MFQASETVEGRQPCCNDDPADSLPHASHSQIPGFPSFAPLRFSHRAAIEHVVTAFVPYSDFNFTSLICYDTQHSLRLSVLNGNLVVRFRDYITGKPFYSFLGRNRVSETIEQVIKLSVAEGLPAELRLVPQEVVDAAGDSFRDGFIATEDLDSFDYVLSVERLLMLDGLLRSKRERIEKLKRQHPGLCAEPISLGDSHHAKLVRGMCKLWQAKKSRSDEEFDNECAAISRSIIFADRIEFVCLGAFLGDSLVGFTINEVVHDGFYMAHFGKADPELRGCAAYLESETAITMRKLGCSQMNFQQDLGLAGLRASKSAWRPHRYLKKYRVRHAG